MKKSLWGAIVLASGLLVATVSQSKKPAEISLFEGHKRAHGCECVPGEKTEWRKLELSREPAVFERVEKYSNGQSRGHIKVWNCAGKEYVLDNVVTHARIDPGLKYLLVTEERVPVEVMSSWDEASKTGIDTITNIQTGKTMYGTPRSDFVRGHGRRGFESDYVFFSTDYKNKGGSLVFFGYSDLKGCDQKDMEEEKRQHLELWKLEETRFK